MHRQIADRLQGIGEYYFSQKLKEIEALNKAGHAVINLGIGSPDLPPHPDVIKELQNEAGKPNVHAYQSYKGSEVLRKAFAAWYNEWYHVSLDPATEILPLMGSKEGIMHICMTYINPGDVVLIPNPGYPTYRAAATIAGAHIIEYDLLEENNWLPDFDQIHNQLLQAQGSKDEGAATTQSDKAPSALMFVNYPHMPTGQLPTKALFEQLIAFAKAHHILICHDNPYSFILNENPTSLLANDGAMDCVLELNSLSKSQNMAGWRVGVLCGSKEHIDDVLRFKSNMDSGMFLPLQLAAAKALSLGKDWYQSVNDVYRSRRNKAYELLELLNCSYTTSQAGMFLWARVPELHADGYTLSDEVLYKANVFITPGGIFGSAGNGFIRVSLCSTEQKFSEAIERIKTTIT